ncbi:MAG: hypothetical protein ACXV5H_10300 [Halobacteriota archaeon]
MADKETHPSVYLTVQRVPRATTGWQGGEPTLMGLDFCHLSIAQQQIATSSRFS